LISTEEMIAFHSPQFAFLQNLSSSLDFSALRSPGQSSTATRRSMVGRGRSIAEDIELVSI
jgi:hypothetical protein